MKKFKINLAIVALLLGSTAAFATSKQLDPTHYKDPVTGEWKMLTAQEGTEEGEYSCDVAESICTGYFSVPNPENEDLPQSNARPGIYILN